MVHGVCCIDHLMMMMFTILSFYKYPPEMKPDTALLGQDGSPSSPTTSFMGGFGYLVIIVIGIAIVYDCHHCYAIVIIIFILLILLA